MSETTTSQKQEKSSAVRVKPVSVSSLQRKCPCSVHGGVKGDENRLQRKPILQRTCACGQHTIGGGSCPTCSQSRLAQLWTSDLGRENGGEQQSVLTSPRFQLDLSRIPATVPLSSHISVLTSGGEGSGDDDSETLIGGETRPAILSVSQRTGQFLQRQEDSGSATLSVSTVTAPTNLGCGGFRDQVRWGLSGAGAKTKGFVVQKVTFDLQRERSDGSENNFQTTYWEGWEVRDGKIYIGTSESRHNADTFQVPGAPDHRGTTYEAGWAKFIPDYEEPKSWGNVPQARSLPSTTSEPLGWSESGTHHRYMRSTFDCVGQSDMGEFESGGSSNA